MRVIPQELCSLADACLSASEKVGHAWTAAQGPQVLDTRDAGNTQGGFDVVAAHQVAADAADVAVGRLVSVLEQDMDDLYLLAFAFADTDEKAAAKLKSTYPSPKPSPTPSPAPGPAPTAPTPTPTT